MLVFPGWILIAVILIGVFVAVVVLRRRAYGTPEARASLVLVVGRFVALLYAGLVTVGTLVGVIRMLVSDAVRVSLPVQQFWPETHPWITLSPAPPASVVGGGFTRADVMIEGLGLGARVVLAAGSVVQSTAMVVVACVIALLCHRLLSGIPFRPVLARSTAVAAAALAIGGVVWAILLDIGGSMASNQVLGVSGWASYLPGTELPDYVATHYAHSMTGLPGPALAVDVELWPLLLALALAAISVAFRYSERLQEDSEGLV
ncbi:MAG: hypothetical protein Q4P15_01280 [Propionibacteriaceae bacterium]|nr:hypothetical protein [Propionibacteriaceae bacterium]